MKKKEQSNDDTIKKMNKRLKSVLATPTKGANSSGNVYVYVG